jgi:Predicted nucleotide-binding protein containing TIR-like domain
MGKPRLFIGSSTEGKDIADTLQLGLDYDVETTVWHQGVFGLSQGNLESLVNASRQYDFAALVLTPDDLKSKRGHLSGSPRDNVIFELGLFMGALGRDRTFIVYCRDNELDLPSDLAGVTSATFAKRTDDNLQGALGSVCTQIKNAIKSCGFASHEIAKTPSQSSEVIVKDGVYFKQDGDGPFCTGCYDSKKELIRISALSRDFHSIARWRCPVCKASYT